MRLYNATSCHCRWIFTIAFLILLPLLTATSEHENHKDAMHKARLEEKPALLRHITMFGRTLPFSPVSAFIVLLAFLTLLRGLTRSSTVTASHILLPMPANPTKDTDAELKRRLEKMKRDINNNQTKFEDMARQFSSCPSAQSGGKLGTFKKGTMVPPFDALVFSKDSKVGTVLGPVKTEFGWHIIYLEDRVEERQLITE